MQLSRLPRSVNLFSFWNYDVPRGYRQTVGWHYPHSKQFGKPWLEPNQNLAATTLYVGMQRTANISTDLMLLLLHNLVSALEQITPWSCTTHDQNLLCTIRYKWLIVSALEQITPKLCNNASTNPRLILTIIFLAITKMMAKWYYYPTISYWHSSKDEWIYYLPDEFHVSIAAA